MTDIFGLIRQYLVDTGISFSIRASELVLPLLLLAGLNTLYVFGWLSVIPHAFHPLIDIGLYSKLLFEASFFLVWISLSYRIATLLPLIVLHGLEVSDEQMRWKSRFNFWAGILIVTVGLVYFAGFNAALLEFGSTLVTALAFMVAYVFLAPIKALTYAKYIGIDPTESYDEAAEATFAKNGSLVHRTIAATTLVALVGLSTYDLGAARARATTLNPALHVVKPIEGLHRWIVVAHVSGGVLLFEPENRNFHFSTVEALGGIGG